jgi:hypothetical protein
MGSLSTSTPVNGPALPDIPFSIRELAVGLTDLFKKADGLALPRHISIFESQVFYLQFAPDGASLALAAWAQRFGAELASDDTTDQNGQPCTHLRADFEFFGVEVAAYAYIPVTATGT